MRNSIQEAFHAYVQTYDTKDERTALKIAHTLRVATIAKELAQRMQLSKQDCELAYLIGILHDIGRFEQIKTYQTFVDAQSVDHAQLGIDILLQDDKKLLRAFVLDATWDHILILAIFHHNKYRIEENLPPHIRLHCELIRDADKLDIFYLSTFTDCEILYRCHQNLLEQQTYTQAVYDFIKEKRSIPYQLRKTKIDILLSHLAMVYDLNMDVSKQWLQEKGYLEKIKQRYIFTNEKTQKGMHAIFHQINQDIIN